MTFWFFNKWALGSKLQKNTKIPQNQYSGFFQNFMRLQAFKGKYRWLSFHFQATSCLGAQLTYFIFPCFIDLFFQINSVLIPGVHYYFVLVWHMWRKLSKQVVNFPMLKTFWLNWINEKWSCHEKKNKTWWLINPYSPNITFMYPLKTSENLWFSGVFMGYKNVTLGEYGLRRTKRIYKKYQFSMKN